MASPAGPFRSAWAKIERAEEHRHGLDSHIRATFDVEANRPRLGVKFDAQTGEHVLYVNRMPDFSAFFERVSLILGDALHNLRSALDHVAFNLVLGTLTRAQVRKVQFPICDTEERFREEIRKRLPGLRADHCAIMERYQPYHGPHDPKAVTLGTLQDLSNTDK